MSIKLSKRLHAVSEQLLKHKKLADIGTDHAYLPSYAYEQEIVPYAIGTEVNEGPFQSALSFVQRLNYTNAIDIRLGDGLSVVRKGEVEQITITGMGGGLITKILNDGNDKLHAVERLILQPNVAEDKVRRWLYANGWTIVNEVILEEDGFIYEIIVADHQKDARTLTEKDFIFGPYLAQEKSKVFHKKWHAELHKQKHILRELGKAAASNQVINKRTEIERMIRLIEEALT